MKDKAMKAKASKAKRQNDKKTPQSKTLIEARTEAKAKRALAVPENKTSASQLNVERSRWQRKR